MTSCGPEQELDGFLKWVLSPFWVLSQITCEEFLKSWGKKDFYPLPTYQLLTRSITLDIFKSLGSEKFGLFSPKLALIIFTTQISMVITEYLPEEIQEELIW